MDKESVQEVGHLLDAGEDLAISDRQTDTCPTIDETVRAVALRLSEGSAGDRVREILRQACDKPTVGPGAAMRCGRALLAAGLTDEADMVFAALATHLPESPAGLVGRARVAMRQRNWRRATGFWKETINQFPSKAEPAWVVGRAKCLFEMEGPTEAARAAARRALERFPDDLDALTLVTQIAEIRGNHSVAVQAWRKFLARSHDVDAYVSALTFAEHTADYHFANEIVASAPPFLSNASEFRYRVLLRLHQLTLDEEAGLKLLQAPIEADLSAKALARIGNFLVSVRQAARAVTVFETALARYPADASLVRSYLTAVWMARGLDAVRAEKARLLPGLRPGDAEAVIRAAPTLAALTTSELNMMFDEAIRTPDSVGAALIGKFLLADDPNVVPDFAERLLAVPNPSFRLVGRLLGTRLADSQRLARAADPRRARQAFLNAALDLTLHVEKIIDEMIKSDDGNPMVIEAIEMLQRVTRQARFLWLNSRESYYDAVSFAEWFAKRVRERQPTSVIRLGDGEGNFLPYAPRHAAHQSFDQRGIQLQWWGEEKFSGPRAKAFSERLQAAIARADAIGIASAGRLIAFLNFAPNRPNRGWVATYNYFAEAAPTILGDKVLTSINIPVDLDQWDLYGQILSSASAVSVVSCHDLGGFLGDRFGIPVRRWFEIPEVKRFSAMFGRSDGPPARPFFPDVFNEIMDQVAPFPGEVFLVAAGVLGKLICDRVRRRGGAALDIGSLADYWAGYTTRAHAAPALAIQGPQTQAAAPTH